MHIPVVPVPGPSGLQQRLSSVYTEIDEWLKTFIAHTHSIYEHVGGHTVDTHMCIYIVEILSTEYSKLTCNNNSSTPGSHSKWVSSSDL